MVSEQKPKKYEQLKLKVSPELVDLTERKTVVVGVKASKRIEDGAVFKNISISTGFKGAVGFQRDRYNHTIELPVDASEDQIKELFKSIINMKKQLASIEV